MFWLVIWLAGTSPAQLATESPTPLPNAASAVASAEAAVEAPQSGALPAVSAAPCIACKAPVAPPLDASAIATLEDGELWLRTQTEGVESDSVGGASRAAVRIARPAREVWAVLVDFESWPDFMPLVDRSSIPRTQGNRRWVRQEYSVMFVDMEHTTAYELQPAAGIVRWHLDPDAPHSIAKSEGTWSLVPSADGHTTTVHYEAHMDSGRAVPALVREMLVNRSLRGLLTGLRDETVRRAGAAD